MGETTRPKILNDVSIDYVDGTPNGGYALRILRAYRERCNMLWETHGLGENQAVIYDLMNEAQKQRALELDKAIEILESHKPEAEFGRR